MAARTSDVAILGDRIRAIEPGCVTPAHQVIDARGLVVSPGFIDVKTHSDFALPLYPRAESRVHQGITTEVIGSCGFTAAPVPSGRVEAPAGLRARVDARRQARRLPGWRRPVLIGAAAAATVVVDGLGGGFPGGGAALWYLNFCNIRLKAELPTQRISFTKA